MESKAREAAVTILEYEFKRLSILFYFDVTPEPGITPLALSTMLRLLYLVPEVALGNNC